MNWKQGILFIYVGICFSACLVHAAEEQEIPGNFKNPDVVEEVLSKKRSVANAAWWGFDKNDSTEAIQGAINSGAAKVIIPYMSADWIVGPVKLHSDQEIFFDPGVVVTAKRGEFKGKTDCLFSGDNLSNVTLRGYGTTLRMNKEDYCSRRYIKSEFRHVLSFRNCSNLRVAGLALKDSGGDGIYLGAMEDARRGSKDVTIENCLCDNNYRQGISVISAENLYIKNCVFRKTGGTGPSAGIDIEPSHAGNLLKNVVVDSCTSEDNQGPGLAVFLRKLKPCSATVSVLFANCHVRGGVMGIQIGSFKDQGAKGVVEFRDCVVENVLYTGTYIYDKSADSVRLRFVGCKWKNIGIKANPMKWGTEVPFYMVLRKKDFTTRMGGIDFINCYVFETKDRPLMTFTDMEGDHGIFDIKGDIFVKSRYAPRIDIGLKTEGVDLKLKRVMIDKDYNE